MYIVAVMIVAVIVVAVFLSVGYVKSPPKYSHYYFWSRKTAEGIDR